VGPNMEHIWSNIGAVMGRDSYVKDNARTVSDSEQIGTTYGLHKEQIWSNIGAVMGPDSYGKDNARTVSDSDQRKYRYYKDQTVTRH
jgi:hypothetical protein